MRMAFGLVSLLVTVAIILYMMVGGGGTGGPGYLQQVAKTNKQLKRQVNVMSGKDPTGQMLAADSIKYRVDRSQGRPKLLVTDVMAGGPLDARYGLRVNDQVVEIGGMDFVDNMGSSRDAATDWFNTAYARNQPIVVVRDGQKVTLPDAEQLAKIEAQEKQAALAAAADQSTSASPAPAASTEDDRSAVQKALDAVRAPRR